MYREDFSLSSRYQLVDTILVSYDSDKDSPDKLPTIKQHIKRNKTQNCTTEVIPLMYRFPRSSFAMNTSKTNKGDNFPSHGDFFTDNIVASNTDFSNILNSPDHRYRDPLLPPKSSTDHVSLSLICPKLVSHNSSMKLHYTAHTIYSSICKLSSTTILRTKG